MTFKAVYRYFFWYATACIGLLFMSGAGILKLSDTVLIALSTNGIVALFCPLVLAIANRGDRD